ncbi:dephospho-CoA kinase [Chryseomicrobium sp. FSL W7-1435]|uniref:dephospho-CoA kinase n=1 Tax=Chryseomicrobium sp. FSL W7-1435 TaxID=2921704 RepID=UPI00315AE902
MIIGLTGSIATGKSTVAKRLKEHGLPIVDADVIARDVVEPGTTTLQKIKEAFGEQAIHSDGTMNREEVGKQIFGDAAKRQLLNSIIHPAIRQEMLRQKDLHLAQGKKIVILDIPLLFESKLEHFVDRILVVATTPEIQLRRLIARNNLSEEEAVSRIASQISITDKVEWADEVIWNNDTLEQLHDEIDRLVTKWRREESE